MEIENKDVIILEKFKIKKTKDNKEIFMLKM